MRTIRDLCLGLLSFLWTGEGYSAQKKLEEQKKKLAELQRIAAPLGVEGRLSQQEAKGLHRAMAELRAMVDVVSHFWLTTVVWTPSTTMRWAAGRWVWGGRPIAAARGEPAPTPSDRSLRASVRVL